MGLSYEEERDLFIRLKETKDNALLNEIVKEYNSIAVVLARRFAGKGLEYDDIYQCACLGLMNAAKRFEPERGYRFSSYAVPSVMGEIRRLFRDKGNCIRVPRRMYEIFSKANKIRNEELVQTGTMPSYQELSETLGVKEEQLAQAMTWGENQNVRSLDQPLNDEDLLLADCIGVEDNEFLMIENKDFIQRFIGTLPEREKQFIHYRFYDELTQAKISQLMHTSQMNISRLEKKVLEHLRRFYQKSVNA